MINGYEEIYGAEGYKGKKYKLLTDSKLVHDLGNCLTDTPLGISTTEAYVSIIEQQIGQDAYSALRDLYNDYDFLVRDISNYQQNVEAYKRLDDKRKDIQAQIDDKIERVKGYQKKLDDLLEKAEDGKASKDIRAEEKKFRAEIANETNNINQLTQQLFDVTEQLADLKPLVQDLKKRIMKEYERLIASLKKLEGINLEGFNKLKDADFEAEIEQDFIDSCLLPGEEKKEEQFRKMAEAKFQMMKMEATYLLDSVEASRELINELRENQLKTPLPEQITNRHSTLRGMNYASTVMIEEYDFAFTQEAFNDYYLYMANLLKKMNYGDTYVEGAENYYRTGIDMGIPYSSTSKIKHLLGEMTGKIKVDYGYDMDMLRPILDGASYMKGGVKFDFNNEYTQETGLRK